MKKLVSDDLQAMEKRYRARLINSLSGFKSVNLVGTVDGRGMTNLSIVSSVVHLGADPPIMGFIMPPVTVTRDTYNNILETGYFTLNHLTESFFVEAHQTSARYPAGVSEFSATGLDAIFSKDFPAPYVAQSLVRIGLEFKEKLDILLNGTVLMIGEIREVFFPGDCLHHDGYLDIEEAGSITVSGLDSYHTTDRLARLTYAKPDRPVSILE